MVELKQNEILINLDFMGNPFIVKVCKTDGGDKKLSTHDWLQEEVVNVGLEDTLYGQEFVNGVYKVTQDGRWNYEHTEFDYDILYQLMYKVDL